MCAQLLGPAENCYGMAVAVVEINKAKEKGQHVLRGKRDWKHCGPLFDLY